MTETRRGTKGAWLAVAGVLVAFGGAVTYFTVFAAFPALRDVPWVNLPLAFFGVLLAALGAWRAFRAGAGWIARGVASLALALSLLFAGGLAAYVFWLSYQMPAPTGTASEMVIAPDVTLTGSDGRKVALGEFRGKKVLVVFYRGFW